MAEVKWIKVAADIFDNRKIRQIEIMPEGDSIIVIWMKILCLAGNVNDRGFIYFTEEIPYTDEMLATEFNRPVQTVRLALSIFQKFGMIDVIDNIYHVSSWEKYQNVDQLEKLREQTRIRVAKHREKQKLLTDSNVTVTLPVTQSNAIEEDKDIDKEKEEEIKKNGLDIILYRVDDSVKETVREFIKMRKTIKAPMTDRAIVLMLNKLKEMASDPDTQIKILNQSIENSWKGLYPLREEAKPKYQSVKPNWDINRQDADDIYAKIEQIAEG